MPFRLYGNENFSRQAVECLRSEGHDVLAVAESGHAGQAWPDGRFYASPPHSSVRW